MCLVESNFREKIKKMSSNILTRRVTPDFST